MNPNKFTLSKSILEMKFMKRTKDKVEKQMIEKEGEDYFGGQFSVKMSSKSDQFIIEPSFVICEGLIEGRLSFKGMNPELEKLLEMEEINKQMELEKKQETDVTDEQMADKWLSLRKGKRSFKRLKQQKVNNNDQNPRKKRKFLKPVD
ncbi:PREDICTED: M-phase phosphoprotein 6 [Polistes dominula]|uniref:M-phase phosphoprotein 6 n=1 Tax=Polistes dominula TaxID=743375 RepID=A0ABM1ILZ5_POLDO|nr:PREDICTED: M-phase phosphoprotein 6 [Polistes dominula]